MIKLSDLPIEWSAPYTAPEVQVMIARTPPSPGSNPNRVVVKIAFGDVNQCCDVEAASELRDMLTRLLDVNVLPFNRGSLWEDSK